MSSRSSSLDREEDHRNVYTTTNPNYHQAETLDDDDNISGSENDSQEEAEEMNEEEISALEQELIEEMTAAYLANNPPSPDSQYDLYDSRTGTYINERKSNTNKQSMTSNIPKPVSSSNTTPYTSSSSKPNQPPSVQAVNQRRQAEIERLEKQTEIMGSLITLTGGILLCTVMILLLGNNDYLPWFLTTSSSPSSARSYFSSTNNPNQFNLLSGQSYPRRGKYYTDNHHSSGRKLQDTELHLKVTLEQLYQQHTVNVTYGHTILCSTCHGQGGTGIRTCPQCHGQGIQIVMTRMGNMIQQMQRPCQYCGGEGRIIQHTCSECHGRGTHHETHSIPIQLTAGLQSQDVVKIPSLGDQHKDYGSGDLLVCINEINNNKVLVATDNNIKKSSSSSKLLPKSRQQDMTMYSFGRRKLAGDRTILTRNDDLQGTIKITLQEALGGFNRTYIHPGNPEQKISIISNQPIQPGENIIIKNCGMPRRPFESLHYQYTYEDGHIIEQQQITKRSPPLTIDEYGDCYIEVQVQLPDSLRSDEEERIRKVFP